MAERLACCQAPVVSGKVPPGHFNGYGIRDLDTQVALALISLFTTLGTAIVAAYVAMNTVKMGQKVDKTVSKAVVVEKTAAKALEVAKSVEKKVDELKEEGK